MAENKIDDGGLAFPGKRAELVQILKGVEPTALEATYPGLTKREWFAIQSCSLPDSTHVAFAEALVGRKEPEDKTDYREIARFWAEADAAYRVIYADALIAALKGGA
ncbi:hypothetical protein ASD54_12515 [Rhizobium sp. Root149]|uniref:hypothetical protein n=1 Tax=Rhizobium sp. Root149 TaxID=1736473 RepID=UPI000713DFBB|nr:hypothetical protein [Rhizobium sp. Root149]KQZ49754.1 hypothetical protein ASD54_12515 [Rhizobium sp. Root149]